MWKRSEPWEHGLNSFWAGFLSSVLSFIALWAGNYVAAFFVKLNIAEKTPVVAELLLNAVEIEKII